MQRTSFWLVLVIFLSSCGSQQTVLRPGDLQHPTTIILVRHAEKADDGTSDPALTPLGQSRAQRLAAMLAPMEVDAVYSTPYKRTRLTGVPTAELKHLTVQEYSPNDKAFLSKLTSDYAGKTILVVGHSNTIPTLVNALTGKAYEQLGESEYDKLFIVEVVDGIGRVMVLSY
ncbi:MAG: phosphoglycerate mutase family protein [Saprospiraceae bacterium]